MRLKTQLFWKKSFECTEEIQWKFKILMPLTENCFKKKQMIIDNVIDYSVKEQAVWQQREAKTSVM